ncbi:helix-hairpin-helix domain-containing protein [Xylanibacillus composti]|uniref:Helix-hairpin-helix DNA-binding motif class 1 domain-containing protein n=1 Tax=Xylanibacillus composti TaxID=1572762 RepID=A0A8J4H6Q3_9BACL|nr:helix-hairpin-helix domain-containing protein [Xylanibacillus composti]MDT9724466.1 helix-hairpin-helix domain-containing protein [Xylanibacillus composti]GIQ69728.1 hypothetical protein XYCOK13_25520 [Xylanibacillus composti]
MSEKRKQTGWLSMKRGSATLKGKSISGKVDVRIEVRQWLLWALLATAVVIMWIWIIVDQSASPVQLGDAADGQVERALGEQTGEGSPEDSGGADPGPATSEEPSPFPVRINRAGIEELQQLPGIGPAKAHAIVQHRMLHGLFESKEELQEVKGIGPKTLENLRDLIAVD